MIDVFICTYNPNYEYLRRTIDSILLQDLDAEQWTLTVVDNNSKNPVSEIDFIKQKKINVIVEKDQGLTAARRCATMYAKNDFLVFVDDDNILAPNYLSVFKEIAANEEIGIVSGNIEPEYEVQPEPWFMDYEGMIAIRRIAERKTILNDKKVYNSLFPIGAGMCVRKSLIKDYYENHLNADNYIEGRKANDLSSAEDIDLDFFALYKGYKIGVSGALRSLHIIPKNRTTIQYILKLSSSSFHSMYLVNKKWSKIFNHNVLDAFDISYPTLIARICLHKLFSFKQSHLIRYNHFVDIFKHRFNT